MAVQPLRKQIDEQGYSRPAEVEARLAALCDLPIEEAARCAAITDQESPEYVPSECLLYFVRRSKQNGDTTAYRAIFAALWGRLELALRVRCCRIGGSSKQGESDRDAQIQEKALKDFLDMLLNDRSAYDDRLDFYECRFNSAVATLRAMARRYVNRRELQKDASAFLDDDSESWSEVEEALERTRKSPSRLSEDFLFRLRFLEAISLLPPDQKQVIEMMLLEKPPTQKEMAELLKCDERTVRNRQKRAYAALRESLKEEDVA